MSNSKTILLVEDEAIIALIHKRILNKYGFNVITVATGEKAVETAAATPGIDLILMDIDLGEGIDGTEAAEQILADREIPLVFLSSHTEPEVVNKTEGITSYGYIVKNSGETVLIASIRMAFKLFDAKLQEHFRNEELHALNEELEASNEEYMTLQEELIHSLVTLRESEERFKALHNASFCGIAIHDKGVILECNFGLAEITGYSADELIGMNGLLLIAEESRDLVMKNILAGYEKPYEAYGLRKDGRVFPLRLEARNVPYKGKTVRTVEFRDLSDIKKSEEAVQVSEEKYRVLFEDSPEPYLLIDDRVIIDCNRASLSLMRCDRSYIVGKSPCEFAPESQPGGTSSRELMNNKIAEVYRKGSISFEFIHSRPDGTDFQAEVSLSLLTLFNKQVIFASWRDISDKVFAIHLMQKTLNRFKALLENSPSHIAIFDSEGRNIEVSKAMANAYGMTPDEIRGKTFYDLLPAEIADDFMQTVKRLKAERKLIVKTDKIIVNGEERIYESRLFPIDVENEGKELFGSIAVDITDRIKAEYELQRTRKELDLIFNSVPALIWVKDISGRYLRVNKKYIDTVGLDPGMIEGKTDYEIFPQETADKYRSDDEKLFKSGKSIFGIEEQHRKSSGEAGWSRTDKIIIRDADDNITGSIGFAIDITDRKNAEDKLRENDYLLKSAQSMAGLGNWMLDVSSGELFWSDEVYRIFGLDPEKFKPDYNNFLKVVHPQDVDAVNSAYTSSIDEVRDFYDIDHRAVRADNGQLIYVHEKCEHIRDDSGRIIRSLGMVQDITDRKKAEEKISLLLKEKELLLKETHHRIKNNMNTVHGLLYLQAEELSDPVSRSIIKDAASRVQNMMILYDKLYRSDNNNEMNVNNYLPSFIDEIISIFDVRIPVKTDIHVDDVTLNAKFLSALGIIINELITNSMKYAFDDLDEGVISLSLIEKDNRVTVVYSDNGPGIPDSVNFENSTGFGMQLIGMLVQQLGGSIRIERGEGIRFVLEVDV